MSRIAASIRNDDFETPRVFTSHRGQAYVVLPRAGYTEFRLLDGVGGFIAPDEVADEMETLLITGGRPQC